MIRHNECHITLNPNRRRNKPESLSESVEFSSEANFCHFIGFSRTFSSSSIMLCVYLIMEYYKANYFLFVRLILKVQRRFLWLIPITKTAWTAGMIWKSLSIVNGPKIKAFSLMREGHIQYCWPVVSFIFFSGKVNLLEFAFQAVINF